MPHQHHFHRNWARIATEKNSGCYSSSFYAPLCPQGDRHFHSSSAKMSQNCHSLFLKVKSISEGDLALLGFSSVQLSHCAFTHEFSSISSISLSVSTDYFDSHWEELDCYIYEVYNLGGHFYPLQWRRHITPSPSSTSSETSSPCFLDHSFPHPLHVVTFCCPCFLLHRDKYHQSYSLFLLLRHHLLTLTHLYQVQRWFLWCSNCSQL